MLTFIRGQKLEQLVTTEFIYDFAYIVKAILHDVYYKIKYENNGQDGRNYYAPFLIIIIVVGWFVITRPPPTENQESMPEKSQPGATEDPNDIIFTCRNADLPQLALRPVDNLDNSTNEDAE